MIITITYENQELVGEFPSLESLNEKIRSAFGI